MAHPKRRQSKTRTLKRRTHDKAVAPTLAVCPNCGAYYVYHTVCPTCGRKLEEDKCESIQSKIELNKNEIQVLRDKYTEIQSKLKIIDSQIDDKTSNLEKIKLHDFSFDTNLLNVYDISKNEINNFKKEISNNEKNIENFTNQIYPNDLIELINPLKTNKLDFINKIKTLNEDKTKIENDNENNLLTLTKITDEINVLKIEKTEIENKKEKISLLPKIESEIDKSNNNIDKYNKQIVEYNKTLSKIENNKKINLEINILNGEINDKTSEINIENESKITNVSRLEFVNNQIKELHKDIKLFNKYKSEDEILNIYMKCVHRDGLPTFLLKKSINLLNRDLENLLYDVNYKIFFDDELELKMSSKSRLDVSQNVIEGSGMERTFASLALKIALRKLNNRSKPNILLLDEVMGKLLADSVDLFIQLLDRIKYQVDKLIIIEHNHPINYDYLIEVDKDEKEISHLKIS
jgi:large subunit ribosomal protein L32